MGENHLEGVTVYPWFISGFPVKGRPVPGQRLQGEVWIDVEKERL